MRGLTNIADVRRFLRRSAELELSAGAVQRLKWFEYALEHRGNVSLTCRHFGIARTTFLKWAKRFNPKNPASLEEHSRRPHTVREPDTDPAVVALIRTLRTEHPTIGKIPLRRMLEEQHSISLSASTIGRVIERNKFFFADTPAHRAKRGELFVDSLQDTCVPESSRDADTDEPLGSSGAWLVPKKLLVVMLSCAALLVGSFSSVHAASTGPQKHIYDGHLLDSSGNPITTAHKIRLSEWKSTDYVSTDTTSTGAINAGAGNYGRWQEVHTVTPDSKGYFAVEMGSVTALPNLASYTPAELASLFLQVEVKASAAADTAYELLDSNGSSSSVDRSPVLSVPFALNADMIDQRDTGTASGSIPVLLTGGLLPMSTVPGGTNRDSFTIDGDSSASTVKLTFGQTIAETLTFDTSASRFTFSDDVRIEGNLTVTGLINGLHLEATDAPLKATSGSNLTIAVASGSYRLNGSTTNYAGTSSVSVSNNTTNYVFFGSGGLTVRAMPFPTDESYIPVAQVTASGGLITAVTDRRIQQSDDREDTILQTLNAEYDKATYQGDGAENVGQLSQSYDNVNVRNYYLWTSTRSSLQDYDIIIRPSLSLDFTRWKQTSDTNPLSITYRSTSADSANNKLDIQIYDTNGSPVTLSGSTTSLANTSWSTAQIEFSGSPTWTAGQDFLIRLKVSARDNFQMHVGPVQLRSVDFQRE